MTRLITVCVLLLLVPGCTRDRAPDPVPTATSGRALQPCDAVVREGSAVTERLIADGCVEGDGTVSTFAPYLCRGSGETVVVDEQRRLLSRLDFPLDQPRSEPPTRTYGTWEAAGPTAPDADVAGCLLELPEPAFS